MVLQIFEIPVIYLNTFFTNKENFIFCCFLLLKLSLCSAKLWSNKDLAPQNYGAMQTLPRKIMEQCRLRPAKSQSLCFFPRKITETLFFAPQNYGAMRTLPSKIMETKFQGPTNVKFSSFVLILFVCKSMLFQRYL